MPNPNSLDPWLAGRHFGVIIDAGSSGSRLQIYSWRDPRTIVFAEDSELAHTLPKVEKGTQNDDWVQKLDPGISSFADNPEDVKDHLAPLLTHARKHIPPSLEKETPLFLLATAGMRLLPPRKQAEILHHTCRFFRLHTDFKLDAPSDDGPCGLSVRIITGEEEGLFGWIAVNYLMDGFSGRKQDRTTYGFLDMGGASTQIAFEPTITDKKDEKNLIDVRLRLLGGQEVNHKVFVTTWLGYGTNQARERYVQQIISQQGEGEVNGSVPDPCLPKNLTLAAEPTSHSLVGTGSFEQCLHQTSPLLNKTAPCPDSPCLMNGIHVPKIDFSVSHFVGVSEYWYSSEHIFGLGGAYDFVEYERAASKFCSRTWDEIMRQHERLKAHHGLLGGDGEVEHDGKIVEVGNWDPHVQRSRLEMQCFKAAWIANVLHDGIGLPRLTDPGGNMTATEGLKVEKEAKKKGLGKTAFQSLDTVGDIAISWTLGKMVLEASKQVPSRPKARPVLDPIENIPNRTGFHIQPIRPPFLDLVAIEDRLSPHLPHVLTRTSLGFSPLLLFAFMAFCLYFLLYPLRRRLRTTCLRSIRLASRRSSDAYALEEGTFVNGNSHSSLHTPKQSWLYPIRRMRSFNRKPPLISTVTAPQNQNLRNIPGSPKRISPTRSYSLSDLDATASSTQYAPRSSMSRSPSPAPALFEETLFSIGHNGNVNQQSGLSSRSRNVSQMNISSNFMRQATSRGAGKAL